MQEVTTAIRVVGYEGLAKAGPIDTAGCRGACHSASGSGNRRLQAMPDEREVVGA